MIIDQFGVFFDKEKASASMTSKTVNLKPYIGRDNPVFISLIATGANGAEVTFNAELQESADNTTFTTVATIPLVKADANSVMTTLRFPLHLKETHCRLVVKVTGETSGITLFAGVTRDHFAPYEKGLYIDKGKHVA